jgi:glycosyltransferase involved in cell wall biosynthesis
VQASFGRQRYPRRVLVRASAIESPASWQAFAEENSISYFTWFNSQDEYEESYLDDLLNAFKYTAARYVTRAAWFDGGTFHDGVQHDYTREMSGKARTLFAMQEFSPLQFMHLLPHEAVPDLPGGYAIDPFELNYRRYLERKSAAGYMARPELSVIVPVFNNGRFLRGKCIESLKRNGCWPRMEVLLVDDGSTDPETVQIVESLGREYPNVRTFFFGDGGSGSASRPRNKAIELATADLITFLDPDNEISPRGYDTLLALYAEAAAQRTGGVDFVSGYYVKVQLRAKSMAMHSSKRLTIIEDLKKRFLLNGEFPVVPTQPAVMARRLFEDGTLHFVERSAGQDTLFGWELLCQAKAGAFTNAVYLIYYAERAGSIVNAIDVRYFEKKRLLEEAQIAMLTRHDLMSAYMKHRYDRFMRGWYLQKLTKVKDETERARCGAILAEIAGMYGREEPVSGE